MNRPNLPEASHTSERTEILNTLRDMAAATLKFMSNAGSLDVYADSSAPAVAMGSEEWKKSYETLLARGVKPRWVTEVTEENLQHCKVLMHYAEVRHLDGVKGNFAVSDSEYLASADLGDQQSGLYSSSRGIVEQNRHVFETLWNTSSRIEDRIKELEHGVLRPETRAADDPHVILRNTIDMVRRSGVYSVCSVADGLVYAFRYSPDAFMKVLELRKKGEHGGVRWVTSIQGTESDELLKAIQYFSNLGMEIGHVENIAPMSFGVSDKEMGVTVERMSGGSMNSTAIFSAEPAFVSHFQAIFDELWRRGVDVKQRISELEGKEKPAVTQIIQDPVETQEKYHRLVSSAEREVMLFLPTSTAYRREDKIGLFDSLRSIAERGVQVRILVPGSDERDTIEEQLEQKLRLDSGKIEVRQIKTPKHTAGRAKIAIVDAKHYLMIEIKDDSKETFVEAVGSAIFSDSQSAVLAYLTMFESLWGQSELYQKVEAHDRMQREFINVAAHELRTPTQAVLGYSELLMQGKNLPQESEEMLGSLNRNALRLHNLISYILDVSRIEAGRLVIEKESVDMLPLVSTAIEGIAPQVEASGKGIEIAYEQDGSSRLIVKADKDKILQVLSNLLDNAVKFSRKGSKIVVSAGAEGHEAVVRVRDFGPGIDPEIFPRLFEKFVTKSEKGTGLGLFISKSMVEAHSGRIWAENNADGRGATFGFAIPLA